MIICLGGGCTEAAVMAMYGIVSADTLRAGGMDLTKPSSTTCAENTVWSSVQTAEQLKIRIGAAVPQDIENSMEVQGQDQVTGCRVPSP
jgi:rod shape-determining protein MreB and related proteins